MTDHYSLKAIGCVTLYATVDNRSCGWLTGCRLWLSWCLIPSVLIRHACAAHTRVVLGHGRRVLVDQGRPLVLAVFRLCH